MANTPSIDPYTSAEWNLQTIIQDLSVITGTFSTQSKRLKWITDSIVFIDRSNYKMEEEYPKRSTSITDELSHVLNNLYQIESIFSRELETIEKYIGVKA